MGDCYFNFNIKRIRMVNYRRFGDVTVELDDQLTVLTAPNGGGKSAILNALAVSCAHFIYAFGITPGVPNGFNMLDFRMVPQRGGGSTPAQGDMRVECQGSVMGENIFWIRSREYGNNKKTRYAKAALLAQKAKELAFLSSKSDSSPTAPYYYAPVIAYYDAHRFEKERCSWNYRNSMDANRFEGYGECLSSRARSEYFRRWFVPLLYEENAPVSHQSVAPSVSRAQILLNAVNEVLRPSGWQNLQWDFKRNDLCMTHPEQGTLLFSQLSDGVQNILNIVSDIAHRALRLNPCCQPDLLCNVKGIVLIDEVDMYLHPGWQQQILPVLTRVFPKIQFVVSTHSPQVLSTVPGKNVRIIDDGSVRVASAEPYGKDASESLQKIFGVSSIPSISEELHAALSELEELYKVGKISDAEEKREKIMQEYSFKVPDDLIEMWKFLS